MEPAETHRASQGAMLGQHQQALKERQQEVAPLKQAVDRLTQQLNQLIPPTAPVGENVAPVPSAVVASKFRPLTMLVVLQLGYSPPCQGNRATLYSVEFGTLATESGWNGSALQNAFYRCLSDWVRNVLVSVVA